MSDPTTEPVPADAIPAPGSNDAATPQSPDPRAEPRSDARPGARACAATGRLLTSGEAAVVALSEPEPDAKPDRHWFSEAAWDDGARPADDLLAFWRTRVPESDAPKTPLIGNDGLLGVFEQLEGTEDPRRIAFRYVLALMLVRKRVLDFAGANASGILVRHRQTAESRKRGDPEPETFEVADPGLDEDAVAAVTEQLESVMELGDG